LREIIVDNFAGGGGASTGIEMATGRSVDIAINHDPAAIAMHKANHPDTEHYCEDVWGVDPVKACRGRPVGLAWFSPDCKHFSKAKGGKPVDKNIRGLAWVAVKWAKAVHPRVIILENVEEFKTWGPLLEDEKGNFYPDPAKKGETFNMFIHALKKFGYKVDWRELRACDYGAPTIRRRFFLIARCDGKKIVWPEPTHGNPESLEVRAGLLKPWRTAAEIIDWSLPCPSIFERKKPLAENTLRRIVRGIQKFVIDNPEPFIMQAYGGGYTGAGSSIKNPLPTITAVDHNWLVAPVISQIGQTGGGDRLHDISKEPLSTIVSKAEHMFVTPFLTQYHSYDDSARGQAIDKPVLTLDTSNRYGLVAAFLTKFYNTNIGSKMTEPMPTITTVGHMAEVRAFLIKYYGSDIGQSLKDPMHTIPTHDRFGLVTIHGQDYQIVDIGMRMLVPRELFNAQGFPVDYIIDRDADGNPYPQVEQVARCGNSVSPVIPEALMRVNLPEQCGTGKSEEAI
jgi:DNA (cytosine-5)-methyltransferase 1